MIKVEIDNTNRTMEEMSYIFAWCLRTFGEPTTEDMRWTYGKEPDWTGSNMCNGTFDIEWFKFSDEKDVIIFKLRFGL